jgi:oligoribonuclease
MIVALVSGFSEGMNEPEDASVHYAAMTEAMHSLSSYTSRMDKSSNLIWLDLEMTGLDTVNDTIIEIATIVTDKYLNELAEGPVLAVGQSKSTMDAMDAWNTRQHGETGLTARVLESEVAMEDAEARTVSFLSKWVDAGASPMCGNSICQDRRFMARQMPTLERFFHYRNFDVSTLKIVAQLWAPDVANGFGKESTHRALADIRDSIQEMQWYREHLLDSSVISIE